MYDNKICAYQCSQPKNGIKGSSSLKTKGCYGVEVLNPKTLLYQHIKADFKRRFLVKMDFGAADFHPQLLNRTNGIKGSQTKCWKCLI